MKNKVLLILLSFCISICFGQQASDSTSAEARLSKQDSALANLPLETSHGTLMTLYSKGYEKRAKIIQSMVEGCARFYEHLFPDTRFDLLLFVLDEKDWAKLPFKTPYGMPNSNVFRSGALGKPKLIMGANKQAVAKLFGQTDDSPNTILSNMDSVALHELGHIFFRDNKKIEVAEKWVNEFLATYFSTCYVAANKKNQGLPQVNRTSYEPRYRKLQDFEDSTSKMEPLNFAWYQGKFYQLGLELYPQFGTALITKFIDNFSPGGKKVESLVFLQQLAPEIVNKWLATMK
jgi:hypothetical protein